MTTKTATSKQTRKAQSPSDELLTFVQQADKSLTWQDLHNAVFGVGGKFGQLFPTVETRTQFAASPAFREISALIAARHGGDIAATMPSGKFNLRIPESLHAALLVEAEREGVSLNQLCMAKLAVQLRDVVR